MSSIGGASDAHRAQRGLGCVADRGQHRDWGRQTDATDSELRRSALSGESAAFAEGLNKEGGVLDGVEHHRGEPAAD